MFTLFRYSGTGLERGWCISIIAGDEPSDEGAVHRYGSPGCEEWYISIIAGDEPALYEGADDDFYHVESAAPLPPRTGWTIGNNYGVDPPPMVRAF